MMPAMDGRIGRRGFTRPVHPRGTPHIVGPPVRPRRYRGEVEPTRRQVWTLAAGLATVGTVAGCGTRTARLRPSTRRRPLPPVGSTPTMTLAAALRERRSVRTFTSVPLTGDEVGALFFAAQGVTHGAGLRSAPSAGALYPLHLYAVTPAGAAHYLPAGHQVEEWADAVAFTDLVDATTSHDAVRTAPAAFVLTAVVARSAGKYGREAERYVAQEVGHAAQNLLLEAVALGLGAVVLGAIDRDGIAEVLALPAGEDAYCVVPVGHPASGA